MAQDRRERRSNSGVGTGLVLGGLLGVFGTILFYHPKEEIDVTFSSNGPTGATQTTQPYRWTGDIGYQYTEGQ